MKCVNVLSSLALVGSLLSATPVFADQINTQTQHQTGVTVQANVVQPDAKKAVAAISQIKKLLAQAEQNKTTYTIIETTYKDNLQSLIQERDVALKEKVDSIITTAFKAGAEGKVTTHYVTELFDKLLVKETFALLRAELKKVSDDWQDKAKVKADYVRATEYFAGLQDWLKATDSKFSVTLTTKTNSGMADIAKAIEEDNLLKFNIAKQTVDKSVMKAMYLQTIQYAVDLAQAAKSDDANGKAVQAAAWATYQVLYSYIVKEGETAVDANYVNIKLDTATDVRTIDSNKINQALVRGFIGVAKSEYASSFKEENWGKDKSKITVVEGNLFLNLLEKDLQKQLGEAAYSALVKTESQLAEAINANDKVKAVELHKGIVASLDQVLAKVNTGQSGAEKAVVATAQIKRLLGQADQDKSAYKLVDATYKNNLQPLVQERDVALKEKVDTMITTAIANGAEGKVSAHYVTELFDKLLVKETFALFRAELKKVSDDWQDKAKAKADYARATEYFAGLQEWLKATDSKFSESLLEKTSGGMADVAKAIDEDRLLNYNIAKQTIDKSVMKAMYLHTNQYASDLEKLAKAQDANVKTEQAATWATYQVLYSYIVKEGETAEDANFINTMFDSATDPKTIDANKINQALVRGFIGVAKSEYAASFKEENWGKDKSKITVVEGNLFLTLLEKDLQKHLGEADYSALVKMKTSLKEAVHANEKGKAEELHKNLLTYLDQVMAKVKK